MTSRATRLSLGCALAGRNLRLFLPSQITPLETGNRPNRSAIEAATTAARTTANDFSVTVLLYRRRCAMPAVRSNERRQNTGTKKHAAEHEQIYSPLLNEEPMLTAIPYPFLFHKERPGRPRPCGGKDVVDHERRWDNGKKFFLCGRPASPGSITRTQRPESTQRHNRKYSAHKDEREVGSGAAAAPAGGGFPRCEKISTGPRPRGPAPSHPTGLRGRVSPFSIRLKTSPEKNFGKKFWVTLRHALAPRPRRVDRGDIEGPMKKRPGGTRCAHALAKGPRSLRYR